MNSDGNSRALHLIKGEQKYKKIFSCNFMPGEQCEITPKATCFCYFEEQLGFTRNTAVHHSCVI